MELLENQKHVRSALGAILGITAFGAWTLLSGADLGLEVTAVVCEFLVALVAGTILVPFPPFLAGLGLSMGCFILWGALTENGIHVIAAIMLPVVLGVSLGVTCLGFAVGILIGHAVKGLLDYPAAK